MPQLDANEAKQVDEAESGQTLIEDGIYEMVLTACTDKDKDGNILSTENAGPYWSWEYTFPEDAERYKKRKVWDKTWRSEESKWKMNQVFSAFGVPSTTNTDDLVAKGARVLVEINTYVIQKGPKAGEARNGVKTILPLAGAKPAAAGKSAPASKPENF